MIVIGLSRLGKLLTSHNRFVSGRLLRQDNPFCQTVVVTPKCTSGCERCLVIEKIMKQLERLQSGNAIRVGIVDVEKERELSFIHNINALPTVKVFRYGLRRRPLAYEGPFDLASLVRLLRDAKRVELVAEARSVRELEAFVHETFDASESLLLAYTPSSREEDLLADLEMLLHRLIEVGTACRLFYTTSKHVYDAVASNDSVVDAAKPAMKVLAHVHHINSDPVRILPSKHLRTLRQCFSVEYKCSS